MHHYYIDWETWAKIGSTVGGFGTILATIAATAVAILLYRQNKQVAEYQQKTALYDKRYEVYTCFIKYFNYAQRILTGEPNWKSISNSIFNNNDSLGVKRFNNINEFRQLREEYDEKSLNREKEADKIESLKREMILEDFNLKEKIVDTIALSEFCFSKKISEPLIFYIDQLLEYAISVNLINGGLGFTQYDDPIKRNLDILYESIKKIQDENIIQKMKDELNLKDTLPQKKKRE